MTTRAKGPGAGFQWLSQGIGAVFRHPGPLLGGAAFLALASLIPTGFSLAMQFKTLLHHAQPNPQNMLWIMPISTLLYLLLMPAYGGYLQVVRAAESGAVARGRDIFKPYGNGEALRLIGFGLVMMLVYFGIFGIILLSVGRDVAVWYIHMIETQAAHQVMKMSLPAHFWTTVALFIVAGLYIFSVYAISLGQVALNQRGVFGAIGDGIVGGVKNVLPLVVMLVCGIMALLVLIIAIAVLALVFALVGKLAGTWLVLLLGIVLDVAMILVILSFQFGTMYYMWNDVCGEDTVTGMTESVAA